MKIRLAFITSVMYAMFMLSSCGNTEQNKEHAQREHSHDSVVENHSHDHGGHSQQMNETREWLKAELGEKYNQSVPIATVKHLDQGKIIYTQYCVICHGSSGKGEIGRAHV